MVIKVSFTGDGCIPKNVKRLLLFAHFGMNERNVLCLKCLCLHAIPARICAAARCFAPQAFSVLNGKSR